MKKTFTIIVILAIVCIGAYYAIINKSSSGTSIDNNQANTPSAAISKASVPDSNIELQTAPATVSSVPKIPSTAKATIVSLDIKNFNFTPSTLKIKTGTKVIWTNRDSVAHTATSDSSNLFDSAILSPGESFSFTFNNSGSVNYHCAIHPTMKGNILIEK